MKTEYKEGELLEFNENGDTKLFSLDYTEMVYVEKGTFNIGDNNSGREDEKEATITFDNGYFIGKYPVTQELYQFIKGENPSNFKGKYRPVENVSWYDICSDDNCFLNLLNSKFSKKYLILLKSTFSLPSEAQWEYAARGGKDWDKPKLLYSGSNIVHDVAWFDANVNKQTMPLGLKQPNALSIYDMSGNIFEWCKDFYIENYRKNPKNGNAYEDSGTRRVLRGGRWYDQAEDCRVSYRHKVSPFSRFDTYGFRLVFQ